MYYFWSWIFIRKVRLADSKQVAVPDPALLGVGGNGLTQYVLKLRDATDNLVFDAHAALWINGGFVAVFGLLLRPWEALHSVEGRAYDIFVVLLVFLICALIVLTWGRYLCMWNRLRAILRGLERTPLRRAFDRLPNTYSWAPLWYEDSGRRAYTISARSVECLEALANCRRVQTIESEVDMDQVRQAFTGVVAFDAGDHDRDEQCKAVERLQAIFRDTAEGLLKNELNGRWEQEGGSDTVDALAERATPDKCLSADRKCQLLAEEFVALRYVGLIHYESAQLKNLVVLLSVGFILALAAIASYPFLAGRDCVWNLAGVFVVFGAAVIMTFAQMDRDAILSRLTRTDPGKLDRNFYLRVASYGTLPLLALVASQYPSIGGFLFAWLQPALNALH
jgi:hypothetical protein